MKKGKRAELRCPHVEYIPEFGQNCRCSKTCRKDKISKHVIHEFIIPAEEDKLLDINSFMSSYLKDVGCLLTIVSSISRIYKLIRFCCLPKCNTFLFYEHAKDRNNYWYFIWERKRY